MSNERRTFEKAKKFRARDFVTPPIPVARTRRKEKRNLSPRNTKPEAAARALRPEVVADGHPTNVSNATVRTATQNTRHALKTCQFPFFGISIPAVLPFPDLSMHVIQAKTISRFIIRSADYRVGTII